jgi:hypothetical protein
VAAGRGAVLLLVAVVLGIFLLNKTDETPTTTVSQSPTTTEHRGAGRTTTTLATTTTTRAPHDPASVKVLAVNGTATPGIGARTKDVLLAARYNTLAPTDAKTKPVKTTVIWYVAGYDVDATAIGRLLGFPAPMVQPLPANAATLLKDANNLPNAHVVVMGGEDLIPKLPAKPATSSTTSTTAKPAATSSTTSTTKKP